MQKCPTSAVLREMQTQTVMSSHLTPFRTTLGKKTKPPSESGDVGVGKPRDDRENRNYYGHSARK